MVDYKEVGRRIRYYRRKKGFTQEQLAFEIQTSAAYLSNIERAVKKPSLQKLMQISETLNISIDDLVSPSPFPINGDRNNLEEIITQYSKKKKKNLLNNLFEIINIIKRNS